MDEIIGKDLEGFLDLLSMKMTDTDLLMEHRYEIVGFDAPDTVYLEVSGDPSMVCENSEKFKKMWDAMEKKWDSKNKRRKRCGSAA